MQQEPTKAKQKKKSIARKPNSAMIHVAMTIKLGKIIQELAESEPKACPVHQKGNMDKHIFTNKK